MLGQHGLAMELEVFFSEFMEGFFRLLVNLSLALRHEVLDAPVAKLLAFLGLIEVLIRLLWLLMDK